MPSCLLPHPTERCPFQLRSGGACSALLRPAFLLILPRTPLPLTSRLAGKGLIMEGRSTSEARTQWAVGRPLCPVKWIGEQGFPTHQMFSSLADGQVSNSASVIDLLCDCGQVTFLLCASMSNSDILEFHKHITRRGVTGARKREEEGS